MLASPSYLSIEDLSATVRRDGVAEGISILGEFIDVKFSTPLGNKQETSINLRILDFYSLTHKIGLFPFDNIVMNTSLLTDLDMTTISKVVIQIPPFYKSSSSRIERNYLGEKRLIVDGLQPIEPQKFAYVPNIKPILVHGETLGMNFVFCRNELFVSLILIIPLLLILFSAYTKVDKKLIIIIIPVLVSARIFIFSQVGLPQFVLTIYDFYLFVVYLSLLVYKFRSHAIRKKETYTV